MKDNINTSNFNFFIYWEDKNNQKTPELVKKCIHIFKQKCKTLHIVNDDNINDYIDTVSTKNIKHIAQKVDYYRAKLLYTYGGIWCDIDTIMLDSLDDEWDDFQRSGKEVCISTTQLKSDIPSVCIAYLMAKKNSIVFKKWTEECEKMIKSKKHLKWAELGGFLLGKIVNQNNFHDLIHPFPNNITYRYGWRNHLKYYNTDKDFIEKEKDKLKLHEYKMIILYGTYMYNKSIPVDTVLNMFLNYNHE